MEGKPLSGSFLLPVPSLPLSLASMGDDVFEREHAWAPGHKYANKPSPTNFYTQREENPVYLS